MNNNKFFLYARKSTDVEDKQVLSIEAQITELRANLSGCQARIAFASPFSPRQNRKG